MVKLLQFFEIAFIGQQFVCVFFCILSMPSPADISVITEIASYLQ